MMHTRTFLNQGLSQRRAALRSRRRGVSMLFFAIATAVVFGALAMGADYGLLVNDKNHWQRAVDAGALAGAQELKKTGNDATDTAKAKSVAIAIAAQNGVTVDPNKITFLDDNTKIRVESSNTRSLYFARVIGIQTGGVSAFAIAGVKAAAYAPPLPVPISITNTTVLTRRATYLTSVSTTDSAPVVITTPRVQDSPYGLNEFLVFDLRPTNAKSPTQMQNQLLNGYSLVKIGDAVTSLNASDQVVNNNFTPAIAARFQNSANAPWNDVWTGNVATSTGSLYNQIIAGTSPPDNPRVVNLIVNKPVSANNGTTDHIVLAFVPVYIESWQNDSMTIRFLPDSLFSGSSSGSSRAVSLLQ